MSAITDRLEMIIAGAIDNPIVTRGCYAIGIIIVIGAMTHEGSSLLIGFFGGCLIGIGCACPWGD